VIQVIQNDPSDVGVQGFGTFPALEAAFMEHVPLVCQNAGLILLGNFHPTGSQPEPALNLRVQQHGECRVLQEKNKPEQTLKKKKTTKIIKSKLDTGDPVFALCVFFSDDSFLFFLRISLCFWFLQKSTFSVQTGLLIIVIIIIISSLSLCVAFSKSLA
jgi:hypothetical protein